MADQPNMAITPLTLAACERDGGTHEDGTLGHFIIRGPINDDLTRRLIPMLQRYGQENLTVKPPVVIHLDSEGGDVMAGWSLAHALTELRELGYYVVVRAEVKACSMAVTLLQFADRREASFLSTIMLHDIQANIAYGDANTRQEREGWLQEQRRLFGDIFAARNTKGLTDPGYWIDTYLGRGNTYLTAWEALDLGLVDQVVGTFPRPPRSED